MSRRRTPRQHRDEDRTLPRGTRAPASTPPSIGSACPDTDAAIEEIWAACVAAGTPTSRRRLRHLYSRYLENAQAEWDFGGYVLTYLSRRGESVPVDATVGERVTRIA